MTKISFVSFQKMMEYDVITDNLCIEIEFQVDNITTYDCCWLGKLPNKKTDKVAYWYGLVPDGSQAYDYDTFDKFSNATVFSGKSLIEIWDSITLLSIDGCDVESRLLDYMYQQQPTQLRRLLSQP